MDDEKLRSLPFESQVAYYTDMYLLLLSAEDQRDEGKIDACERTLSHLKSVLSLTAADIMVIEARTVQLRTQVLAEIADILDGISPPTRLN